MKTFLVTAGTPKNKEVNSCVNDVPTMLAEADIKDVKLLSCYCCTPPEMKKIIAEFEAPSKDVLSKSLAKLKFSVENITEATKIWDVKTGLTPVMGDVPLGLDKAGIR